MQDWNHVPGTLNPADYVSRGMTPSSQTANHNWLRGPDFLWGPEDSWPGQECRNVPTECLELKKETHLHSLEVTPDSAAAKKESPELETIIDPAEPPPPSSDNNLLRLDLPQVQGSMALTICTVH